MHLTSSDIKTQCNGPEAETDAQEKMGAVVGLRNEGHLFSEGVHSSPKHIKLMSTSCPQCPPILYLLIL